MIAAPIEYCEEDLLLVVAFEALPSNEQDGSYWAHAELKDLKARVKSFYIHAQNIRCCYCNRHLGTENLRIWDVEHIASRSKHARFMFTPTNLAAACPDCNKEKSDQEALVNSKRKTYPTKSADFKILHPHFDSFEDHIYCNGHIYAPKTAKGNATIRACNLLRFAQKYIDWTNSAIDTSFEKEVDSVFEEVPGISQAAVDAIVAKLPPK